MSITPPGYLNTTETLFNTLGQEVAKVQAPFTTWRGYPVIVITDLVHKAITVGIVIPLALIEEAILIAQVYNGYVNDKFLEKLIAYHSLTAFNSMLLSTIISLPKRKSAPIIEITSLYHHHRALSELIENTKEWDEDELIFSTTMKMLVKVSCAKHKEYFTLLENKEAIISHLKSTQQFEALFYAITFLITYYSSLSLFSSPCRVITQIMFNPFKLASDRYIEWIDNTSESIDTLEEAFDGKVEPIDVIAYSSTIKKVQDLLDRIKMGKISVSLIDIPLLPYRLLSVKNQISRSSVDKTIDWFMENHEDWMTNDLWNDIMTGIFLESPNGFANIHVFLELASGSLDNDPIGLSDTDQSIFKKYLELTNDQSAALTKRLVTQIDDSNGATDELFRFITTRGSKMMIGPTFILDAVQPALEKRNIQERG